MSPNAKARGTLPRGTEPLTTGVAREPGPLADLAAEWELLRSASPTASPFMSHAWQAAWWAALGSADSRRRLVVVTARAGGGPLVGVLPLFVEPLGLSGAGGRVGRLLGTGSAAPDHLDAIVDRRDHRDTLRTLLEVVGSPAEALDVVALTDLDEGASLRRATARWAMEAGLAWRERVAERCPWLPLDGTYDTYVANLAAKHRYKLRRFDRRLRDAGRVDLEIAETPDEVSRSLEEVFRLHALRWAARRARSSFDTPAVRAFHRRMAPELAAVGGVRIHILRLDGRAVAANYCLRAAGRVCFYQPGFDPAFRRLQVGKLLLARVIEHAFAVGDESFDFLRGEEAYKFDWTHRVRPTYTIEVALTRRGRAWLRLDGLRRGVSGPAIRAAREAARLARGQRSAPRPRAARR